MTISLDNFKKHIQFEEGMDDSMLSFYLDAGKKYARRATGTDQTEVSFYIASIFWLFKVPEKEMENAFNALTPLILQEGLVTDAETNGE